MEPPPGRSNPILYTKKLALVKARRVARQIKKGLILGADTVVVYNGKILGKPADSHQAVDFLSRLEGTTHRVITGVALIDAATGKYCIGHAVSFVTMRRMNPMEVARYAKKHLDKAGAYAVQEKKDPVVVKIRGSYTNVVGLPMELLEKLLEKFRS